MLNTELMQQVVAKLNSDKEFKNKSEKLTKYNNQGEKITKVEKVLGGISAGGTGSVIGGMLASFSQNNEVEQAMVYTGAGILGASMVGIILCEKVKEHIKGKSTDLYNDVYSQVKDNYVAKVKETNQGYNDKKYLREVSLYQFENETVFDIADFADDGKEF